MPSPTCHIEHRVTRDTFADFPPSIAEICDQYDRERIQRDADRADMQRVAAKPWRTIKTVDEQ